MIKRWILYLVFLAGCSLFYAAHQGWVSWVLLAMVISVPLFSLTVSLGPMLLVRPTMDCPTLVTVGDQEALTVRIQSPLPLPPCRCRFRVSHTMTGESSRMKAEDPLPTQHCGALLCHSSAFYVYDYMNMFRIPLRRIPDKRILIRPKAIAMKAPKELERFLSRSWQPKYGGGFSEQHELRLYRPGDGLNQVHWKLSAKTGKLIIREPMIPRHGLILLTMDLKGEPDLLDRKLGKLLWMGTYLLEMGLHYEIHVHTANGVRMLPVHSEGDLPTAIDTVLSCAPATEGTVLDSRVIASWQYHIGGDDDEA